MVRLLVVRAEQSLTEPVVELLDLGGEAQLGEVARVQQHVAVGHLDAVRARVCVRHAHKPGVSRWLGIVVRNGVHPEETMTQKRR